MYYKLVKIRKTEFIMKDVFKKRCKDKELISYKLSVLPKKSKFCQVEFTKL